MYYVWILSSWGCYALWQLFPVLMWILMGYEVSGGPPSTGRILLSMIWLAGFLLLPFLGIAFAGIGTYGACRKRKKFWTLWSAAAVLSIFFNGKIILELWPTPFFNGIRAYFGG